MAKSAERARLRPATASRLLACTALLAATVPAAAQERFGEGLDVGLTVQRSEQDLGIDGAGHETRISRLGLSIWESSLPWVQFGLQGGPIAVTQSGNPATAGMELTGYFVGIGARSKLYSDRLLDLDAEFGYTYYRADDSSDGRETRLAWYEGRAQAAVTLKLDRLHLSSGAFGMYVDGDQTGDGLPTRDLEQDEAFGGFLDVSFWVDADGRIQLRGEGGARNSLSLTFARRF